MLIGIWSNIFYPINPIASILIIGIVVGYFIARKRINKNSKLIDLISQNAKKLTIIAFVLLIIFQLLIVTFFKASVYHDPFRVLYQADLLSHHNFNWNDSTYFSHCPNNIPLVYLLAQWFKFTQIFNLPINWALNLLCIITVDIFIALVVAIIKQVSGKWMSCLKVTIFFLITPLAYSYLLQVFYSDILLLISVCGIWLALVMWPNAVKVKKILLTVLIFLCGLLGMLTKPSIVVLIVSLGVTAVLFRKKNGLVFPAIALIVGISTAPILNQQIINEVHFSIETKYKLPVNTWIYMGLNNQTSGTYARKDINRIENLSEVSRFKDTNKLIAQRVKKLNPIGVVKQWVSKIEICENVGTVQGAYMSGNYCAPAWFVKWQPIVSVIVSVIFRSLIILIMLRIIKICVMNDATTSWLVLLTKLTILGFIAFYSIVWETECRYGLILLPLYLILIAIPMHKRQAHCQKYHSAQIVFNGLVFGFLLLNLFTQNVSANINNFSGVITAQNSQLSSYYKAKLTQLAPHTTISEQVQLTGQANDFSVIVPKNSKVKVELIFPNNETKCLDKRNGYAYYHGTMKSGRYQIRILNETAQTQTCTVIAPSSYKLAKYPIKGDIKIKNGYLVYSFENRRLK